MGKLNKERAGCKDVFHAFLVERANYDGFLEIPRMDKTDSIPSKLISFTKALRSDDYSCWVHFFEDDASFERIWNNPRKYLPILKKFAGVISPDFSLYRDMPLVMQYWNIYRSRAIARWLQDNGVDVIVDVRWGDKRSFAPCCYGVPKNGIIAVGTHGCIKKKEDRLIFAAGLKFVVETINPKVIVVYGAAPDDIFKKYKDEGILVLQFESDFAFSRRKEDA